MRVSRPKSIRWYAATALCQLLVTIIFAQLASLVSAAPTALVVSPLASLEPCQQVDCLTGHAIPDPETGACICPGSDSFRVNWRSSRPLLLIAALTLSQLSKIYEYLDRFLPSPSHLTRQHLKARQANTTDNNNATSVAPESPATTTFLPPLKTDITPQLIQQSLSQQPQSLGQISAVQPFFLDGVIQFTMSLAGSTGSTGMLMNASTKIPASTIGNNNEPSLIIVPESVKNGSEIVTTETATIIAMNMYNTEYLNFWVLLNNGTTIPLLSDCKVHDIDRIDPSTARVAIMPSPLEKRDSRSGSASLSQAMARGISKRAADSVPLGNTKRGIEGVNSYNTKMTQKSCNNMNCTINNESPMWNMFTATCYCETTPPSWIVNPSGETSVVSD